jgi:choline dehydrogenase-like flavoprotein
LACLTTQREDMNLREYDFLIIGSGAGGATVARELAMRGKDVLIVEKGNYFSEFGSVDNIVRFHDAKQSNKSLRYSKEGVMLLRTFMAGGSTVVSCGNGVRCLEKELLDLGISLQKEFTEAESEMAIMPISGNLLSEGSKAIMRASEELGYKMELMPKFINTDLCTQCGLCNAGCQKSAKWTALNYLEQAKQSGADILYGTEVQKVFLENGKARGVIACLQGVQTRIIANTTILCAGALATPIILQQSGIKDAGTGLFVDMFINVYGVTNGLNQLNEPPMALIEREFYHENGFILSTFINHPAICRFAELGTDSLSMPYDRLVGLMIKIRDESLGYVRPGKMISKPITQQDQLRLQKGCEIAKKILTKAGADDTSFAISNPQGAHPGGTAAIGKIVNCDLQTEIDNLFVGDASVLPVSPGLPPILTIVALAKRLGKRLVN